MLSNLSDGAILAIILIISYLALAVLIGVLVCACSHIRARSNKYLAQACDGDNIGVANSDISRLEINHYEKEDFPIENIHIDGKVSPLLDCKKINADVERVRPLLPNRI